MKVVETAGVLSGVIFCMLWVCSCSLIDPAMKPHTSLPGSQKVQPAPESETEYFFLHLIRWSGENFTTISQWYTGTVNNWTVIQEINSSIDPKQIDIGDSILIPENLLITRKPMPKDFHEQVQKKTKPSSESSPEVSSSNSDTDLFAPIDTETQSEELFAPVEIETQTEELIAPVEIETQTEELFAPVDIETQAEELFAPVEIETQTEELFAPVDIETQAEELFAPVEIETQTEELFAPVDIETQIKELNNLEKDALALPLETIE